jgi:Flp pilus assembly protein TadG
MRTARTGRRLEQGQALVEFAAMVPLLAMLSLAAIDVGRAFDAQARLAHAAREGARYCASNLGQSAETELRVRSVLGTWAGHLDETAPISCPAALSAANGVTVTAGLKFVTVTPYIANVAGPVRLRASAAMVRPS